MAITISAFVAVVAIGLGPRGYVYPRLAEWVEKREEQRRRR